MPVSGHFARMWAYLFFFLNYQISNIFLIQVVECCFFSGKFILPMKNKNLDFQQDKCGIKMELRQCPKKP